MSYRLKSRDFPQAMHKRSIADRSAALNRPAGYFYTHYSRDPALTRKKIRPNTAQILLFPTGDVASPLDPVFPSGQPLSNRSEAPILPPALEYDVVVSGSFRRDIEGLRRVHQELSDQGCIILSPRQVEPAHEVNGFVFMKGEESETPEDIELRHLESIQDS